MPVFYSTPDGRVGALESALGDQAVVDPLGGVTLPGPAAPVPRGYEPIRVTKGSSVGDSGALPTAGGLSERSGSLC